MKRVLLVIPWVSVDQGSKIIHVIGGDFNCNANKQNDNHFKKLWKLFEKLDLIDINVWHNKNPNNAGFTWCDAQNCPKSRIDYISVKSDCIDHVKNIIVIRLPCTYNNKTRLSNH